MNKKYALLWSILLYVSFAIYLALLLYLLFFQRMAIGGGHFATRSVNLAPFATIRNYAEVGQGLYDSFAWTNIFGNILMFAPLGLYLPVMISGKKIRTYALWLLLFTVCAEILQWIFAIGVTDIDDVILNWLGGMMGLMAYKILLALFRQEHRVKVFTAVFSTIVGVPVLFIAVVTYLHNR